MQQTHPWKQHTDALLPVITQPHFGVISDFDGTLSPFVGEPQSAAILPACAAALDALRERGVPLALVSGRAVLDLQPRFPRPGVIYYGNHGMDYWHEGKARIAEAAEVWEAPLQLLLAQLGEPLIPGVTVENKQVTASVHYRAAVNPAQARLALQEILLPLCQRFGFRLSEDLYVWEIKPPVALDKGTALTAIIKAQGLESVLFLGDDLTDFAAMQQLRRLRAESIVRGLSIGVIHPTSPPELFDLSDLTTNNVDDTALLLQWIAQQLP
ncbi:MAG: trehalose-phosphatase [Anaerolineae bacterium]